MTGAERQGVRLASNDSLMQWSESQCADFGRAIQCTHHRLHETDLFSDESLTQLLDHYPRKLLQAFTMGTDATKRDDWAPVEIGALSGAELLAAVKRGRLWLNILRVQDADMRLKDVLDRAYTQLANDCPHFKPLRYSGTLLISSPNAQVYYHVDGPPNLLWHIRGSKRIYVYPAEDRRLVPLTVMEDIFASVADEEMPFDPSFDHLAVAYDLKPGDVASWPHNSPHRVVNTDGLNVSLSTNHWTRESEHRKLVYVANRFFRRRVGFPMTSTREDGVWAKGKCLAYLVCRRLGFDKTKPSFQYEAKFRVDPNAPLGVAPLSEPARTSFAV
jgi:hypothetical protein